VETNRGQAAKRAIVQSDEANVRRLEELESFKHYLCAIQRRADTAEHRYRDSDQCGEWRDFAATVYLAQTDPIRVYVNVPEPFAPSIHAGIGAYLELTQYPGENSAEISCAHVECD